MFKVLITPLLNTFSIYSAKQINILLTVQTSTQFDCYTCISWSRLFYVLTSWLPVFTEEVAFTVVHDGTGQRITHHQQVVKYNQVQFNIGGGYRKYSGRFVAPVKGTYVFFFSLEPTPGTKASFYITVNDRGMVEGVSGAICYSESFYFDAIRLMLYLPLALYLLCWFNSFTNSLIIFLSSLILSRSCHVSQLNNI